MTIIASVLDAEFDTVYALVQYGAAYRVEILLVAPEVETAPVVGRFYASLAEAEAAFAATVAAI